MARAKMQPEKGEWRPKHGEGEVFLPCRKRYSMALVVEFRKSSVGPDTTAAFAVFWLQDIPDEEEKTIKMRVWNGGKDNLKKAVTCSGYEGLHEGEQSLGEIEVTMKFWSGLSGYHKKFAGKHADMQNVMEVLDTANDEKERGENDEGTYDDENSEYSTNTSDAEPSSPETKKPGKLIGHTNDSTSSSGEDVDTKNPLKKAKNLLNGRQDSNDGSRGPLAQVKDYKDHHKQLHRTHRGIMQWKAARTAEWAVDKAKGTKGKIEGSFEHGDKGQGVEREV